MCSLAGGREATPTYSGCLPAQVIFVSPASGRPGETPKAGFQEFVAAHSAEVEKAMAPHTSTLAWKIPWTEEPGRLQSMGSLRVGYDFTFTFHFHALEKEMATHSSIIACRVPGTGEPGGLLSMGSHRVGHDSSDLAAAAAEALRYIIPIHGKRGT